MPFRAVNAGEVDFDRRRCPSSPCHRCHELGLLVRPLINMCVMSPPLIITEDQIDDMVATLRDGISRTMEDLRKEGVWS